MAGTRLPSYGKQDQAAEQAEIGSRLPSYGGTEIPFDLPEPEKQEEPRNYGWGITTAFKRGFERLRSLPDVAQGDYEELAMHFENMEKFDLSEHDQQRMQELQNTDGWWDAFAYYIKNPALISQVVAESLPMSTAPILGGVAGGVGGTAVAGPPGTVAGTIGGAAAGSYATEYLASITEHFGKLDIDLTDPNQLRQAFGDQQIMSDARDYAHTRGVPIAIFDGLSFGLAGRIYKPVKALVGKTRPIAGGIAGGVAEMTMQAGAGMAGEATAQYRVAGEITDIPGVWAEGFGEIVPGAVEAAASNLMRDRADEIVSDSLSQQLDADITAEEEAALLAENGITDKLSYQAARAQEARDQLQIQQYQDMATTARRKRESGQLAVADLEAVDRENQRLSEAFFANEMEREAALERQRREAEFQQEVQEGEAAAEIAPHAAPEAATAPEVGELVSAPPMPGTSLGEALIEAGVKPAGEADVTPTEQPSPAGEPTGAEPVTAEPEAGAVTTPEITERAAEGIAEDVKGEVPAAPAVEPAEKAPTAEAEFTEDALATEVRTQIDQLHTGSTMQQKRSANKAIIVLKKAKHPQADELRTEYREAIKREEAPAPVAVEEAAPVVEEAAPAAEESQDLDTLKDEAQTSPTNDMPMPTKAQKKAGNYKMAHRKLAGLDVTIENPVGSTRRGFKMKDHYGYIKRTEGADGDQVDVFVNPKVSDDVVGKDFDPTTYTGKIYVIDQTTEDGVTFDEHKVMLGYNNQLDAVRGYKRNYEKGWKVGPVTEMSLPEFKTWLARDTTTPIQERPSRQARKFARTQKGLKYSKRKAAKVRLDDTREQVPGVDREWVDQVLGSEENIDIDAATQELITGMIEQGMPAEELVTPVTKKSADKALTSLRKAMPKLGAQVHENYEAMPESDIKSHIELAQPDAFYDTVTDEVHIFADRYTNEADVVKAALHEGVAHKGLRYLYDDMDALNSMLDDVYANATNRKSIAELEQTYLGQVAETPRDKQIVAEEYIAKIAEDGTDVTVMQRIVASIRRQLRRLGIVQDWTLNDVNNLLRETRSAIAEGRPLVDVTLTDEIKVQETGEVFTVETDAEVALRQHDKRVGVIKKLRGCL